MSDDKQPKNNRRTCVFQIRIGRTDAAPSTTFDVEYAVNKDGVLETYQLRPRGYCTAYRKWMAELAFKGSYNRGEIEASPESIEDGEWKNHYKG